MRHMYAGFLSNNSQRFRNLTILQKKKLFFFHSYKAAVCVYTKVIRNSVYKIIESLE